jgi:hypothetical protein
MTQCRIDIISESSDLIIIRLFGYGRHPVVFLDPVPDPG